MTETDTDTAARTRSADIAVPPEPAPPAAQGPGTGPAAVDPGDTGHPDPPGREPPEQEAPPAGPRRYGLAVVVLAVVAGLLAGFAAGVVALRPDPTPGETSPEAGFARDMTAHHAQAVDMGTVAMANATTQQVRNLGLDIALAQQYEMAMMQEWLRDWDLQPTGTEPPMAWMDEADTVVNGLMPGMASREEMNQLRDAEGPEVDLLFLDLMITHHLGGVHMVDGVLARSDHPDVTRLATAMKDVQAAEVQVMIDLRDTLAEEGS